MVRSNAFFALALVLLAACNKPLPNFQQLPFAYTVSGIADLTVAANGQVVCAPAFKIVTGSAANQPVTMWLRGLPANVHDNLSGAAMLLNNSISDSIFAINADTGTYPITVVCANAATDTQFYHFNLVITAAVSRVYGLAGYYYPSNSCLNDIYVSCDIEPLPGSLDSFMIVDRTGKLYSSPGTYDTTYGYVDCCSNTFKIPPQRSMGGTVSGYGSFNALASPYSVVTMNRTYVTDTATYYCVATLTQN